MIWSSLKTAVVRSPTGSLPRFSGKNLDEDAFARSSCKSFSKESLTIGKRYAFGGRARVQHTINLHLQPESRPRTIPSWGTSHSNHSGQRLQKTQVRPAYAPAQMFVNTSALSPLKLSHQRGNGHFNRVYFTTARSQSELCSSTELSSLFSPFPSNLQVLPVTSSLYPFFALFRCNKNFQSFIVELTLIVLQTLDTTS